MTAASATFPQSLVEMVQTNRAMIVDFLTQRIVQDDRAYSDSVISYGDLRGMVDANVVALAASVAGGPTDLEPARVAGRHKAELHIPLDSLLHAYRVAGLAMWDVVVDQTPSEKQAELPALSRHIWSVIDRFSTAAADAYREATGTLDDSPSVRARLLESYLDPATGADRRSALATRLGVLEGHSHLVTVGEAITLPTRVVASYLFDSVVVTLLSMPAPGNWGAQLKTLPASVRVGVSRPFTASTEAPEAYRQAQVARRCIVPNGGGINHYGSDPIQALVAENPVAARSLLAPYFSKLNALPPADVRLLTDTALAWFARSGSTSTVGRDLHLHRNTVLARLKRVESLTGLSFQDPGQAALLYFGFQANQLAN